MNSPAPLPSTAAINLRRLVLIRAIVLVGQAAAVWIASESLHMALPLRPLALILAAMAVVNLLSWLRLRREAPVREAELAAQLVLDVAALTGLLYYSGGPTNPFVLLYLLPLAFAAAALPGRIAWVMAGVTTACYTWLMFHYVPLPHSHGEPADEFGLHVLGMWFGYVLSAGLIAGFAARMSATLRERDRMFAEMRERELRAERVLALGALAAGAAHELGTPLSTMAVLLKDMEADRPVAGDKLAILRDQIRRCKEILSSVSASAGEARAEAGGSFVLDAYLEDIVRKWLVVRPGVQVHRHFAGSAPAPRIVAEQTLSQAIMNLLNNAADASPESVEVEGRWSEDTLTLEIADRGPGLAPEVREKAGKRLVTTKGEGLGLGLFLAYTTLNRLGGEVRLLEREGGGVLCRLTLPLAPLRVPA